MGRLGESDSAPVNKVNLFVLSSAVAASNPGPPKGLHSIFCGKVIIADGHHPFLLGTPLFSSYSHITSWQGPWVCTLWLAWRDLHGGIIVFRSSPYVGSWLLLCQKTSSVILAWFQRRTGSFLKLARVTEFNLWVSFSFSGELPSSSFKTQFRMEEPAGRISALGRLFRRKFPQRAKAVLQQTGPTVKNAGVFASSQMNRRLRRQTAGGTEQEDSQLLPFFFNKHSVSPPAPQVSQAI